MQLYCLVDYISISKYIKLFHFYVRHNSFFFFNKFSFNHSWFLLSTKNSLSFKVYIIFNNFVFYSSLQQMYFYEIILIPFFFQLMEQNGLKTEESDKLEQANQRLREAELNLITTRKEIATYQNMLEQSQNQYLILEKKYNKAKQLVREFQQRELDMIHREDFYQQLLREKDTEYNALVKNLKDRIIALEQDLMETQKKAGIPIALPYDSIALKQLTPQMMKRQPPVPLLQALETDFSDTEVSDVSPDDGDKTATVERKLPIKEEFDRAVPPHELLDISASKSKAELVNRGALANRQLPSAKKGSLSNSSSDYGLDESGDELIDGFSQSENLEVDEKEFSQNQEEYHSKNMQYQSKNIQYQCKDSQYQYKDVQYQSKDSHYESNDSQYQTKDHQYQTSQLQSHNSQLQNVQSQNSKSQNSHYIVQPSGQYAQNKAGQYISQANYNLQNQQNPNILYAKVQKDLVNLPQSSPDPWSGGANKSGGLTMGPPSSLAEQLKQVFLFCLSFINFKKIYVYIRSMRYLKIDLCLPKN